MKPSPYERKGTWQWVCAHCVRLKSLPDWGLPKNCPFCYDLNLQHERGALRMEMFIKTAEL